MAKAPEARPTSADEVARAFQGIQRSLGIAVTEVARETAAPPPSDPAASSEPSDSRSAPTIARTVAKEPAESVASMTVARPVPRSEAYPGGVEPEPSGDDEGAGAQSVRMRWIAVGGAVVLLVIALGLWAVLSAGEEGTGGTTAAGGFEQEDDLFSQPFTPTAVVAAFTDSDTVEVAWSEVGVKETDVFRVQRVDSGFSDDDPVEVNSVPAVFNGIDATTPCFRVVMIRSGRISTASQRACASR